MLARGLARLKVTLDEVKAARQNSSLKQGLAWLVKSKTVIGNDWICRELEMGSRTNLSRAARIYRAPKDRDRKRIKRILQLCADPYVPEKK